MRQGLEKMASDAEITNDISIRAPQSNQIRRRGAHRLFSKSA